MLGSLWRLQVQVRGETTRGIMWHTTSAGGERRGDTPIGGGVEEAHSRLATQKV